MGTTATTQLTTDRFDVQTDDGVTLAVWVAGDGPPLVMVHGSLADHTTFDPFVAELRAEATTFRMDRRGFGASGDGPDYSIERDFADVAAVVDAVTERVGERVALWGHSYGANAAIGGAELTTNVRHLVLYEPSLGLRYPPGSIAAVEAALARGDHDTAIATVLVDILEMTDDEIDGFRSSPMWPRRLAAAPTIPRECHAEEDWVDRPFDGVRVPTLMLTGSDSVPPVVEVTHRLATGIPDVRIEVLDGHAHFAHRDDPAMVAELVHRFIAE